MVPMQVWFVAVAAVAAAGEEGLSADDWYDIVKRSHPYRELAREVYDSVIDLVSGVYPSTDFAELKPRVVYDRVSGVMTPRPGAQRVAVTSGGTIPDRGMFGVFLYSGGESGKAPRRVGELDEEMVYESRVGDVFTLGASSWRIENITRDADAWIASVAEKIATATRPSSVLPSHVSSWLSMTQAMPPWAKSSPSSTSIRTCGSSAATSRATRSCRAASGSTPCGS